MAIQRVRVFFLALILFLTSAMFCAVTAKAETLQISPYYINATAVDTNLSISGTTANVYVALDGNNNTKSISVTYSLQQKSGSSWSTVKSWNGNKTGVSLSVQQTYSSLTKGAQYRVYATFSVNGKDGQSETIPAYSSTYTC